MSTSMVLEDSEGARLSIILDDTGALYVVTSSENNIVVFDIESEGVKFALADFLQQLPKLEDCKCCK